MSIARKPHPVFTVVWAVLMGFAIHAGIVGLDNPWYALKVGLAIVAVEIVAVVWKQELRDTLSEITTYVNRKLSKHRRAVRGWNSLVALQAAVLGRLVYVIGVGFGGPEIQWYALAFATVFALGQHDHWLNPPEHG